MSIDSDIDTASINTIRTLSMDAVEKANSGHPGAPMGAAPMAYAIWTRFLRHDPAKPDWFNRDRFVLSPGHASMLLYSLLHLSGYDLPLEDIKNFRQLGSKTPGHPERGHTPGVEMTTGPLGAGFSMGVGLAIAERFLAEKFNRDGFNIVDHFTYGIASDGDLMEGVASEAASLAGTLGLGKLIYLYDDNGISIEGDTDIAFTENVVERFKAYGWSVYPVDDGNDLDAISAAIERSKQDKDHPSLVVIATRIGFGSPKFEGTPEIHGSPMGAEEIIVTKRALGWPENESFLVPDEVRAHFEVSTQRGREQREHWESLYDKYATSHPELAESFALAISGELPDKWSVDVPRFGMDEQPMATRVASGKVLNGLVKGLPTLIGGSADLAPSTNTYLSGYGDIGHGNWSGRNMHFGVREHAMGGAVNGMALHGGVIPFGATFLIFSDYMRPALRLAALQQTHAAFVFTHDSIGLGEDGPTHQPIEHLASLRAIPGLTVYRPADANETAACWDLIISRKEPAVIVLSRQALPVLDPAVAVPGAKKGAYVLADADAGNPEAALLATGSEVSLALKAKEILEADGIPTRVVSMPSWEIFEDQTKQYRDSVIPPRLTTRISIEAASPMGWWKYVGSGGDVIAMESFGASAPAADLFEHFGFTPDQVARKALAVVASQRERAIT